MPWRQPGRSARHGWAALALLALIAPACADPAPTGSAAIPASAPGQAPNPTDALLDALHAAPDAQTAAAVEQRLRALWLAQVTPAVQLLLLRARRELDAREPRDALEDFDATLDLQPDAPELHRQRAEARFAAGDYPGAVRDIQADLASQPRDFAAWMDLSRMAQAQGDARHAYDAWRHVLELDPRTEDGATRLDMLRRRAFGQPT